MGTYSEMFLSILRYFVQAIFLGSTRMLCMYPWDAMVLLH